MESLPKPYSLRTQELSSFIAMDILEECQRLDAMGNDIVNFSIGEPDFPAPAAVKQALEKSLEENFTHYTHSLGLVELREEIVSHYRRRYGVSLHPDQIVVTAGTSPAMLIFFGALLNPGDEVVMSDPAYPCYANFIRFAEGQMVRVPVRESEAFQLDPERVFNEMSSRTKAILINSPSNPTGCTYSSETMQKLAGLGKFIISDEVYHGLTYEGEERSILEFTDQAFVLNGFSKAYSMTGFRLGYGIFPRAFTPVIQKMAQNFFISTSSFVQRAGIAALTRGQNDQKKMREEFNRRRQTMIEGLKSLGFKLAKEPLGAFYVFANARHLTNDSYAFAYELLRGAKVGVTPGIDFGPEGEGFLRFSYATKVEKIKEGLKRIKEFLMNRQLTKKG